MRYLTFTRLFALAVGGSLFACDRGSLAQTSAPAAAPVTTRPAFATSAPALSPVEARRVRDHEAMRRFYEETLIKPYETAGRRSDRWDFNAREALEGLVDSVMADQRGEAMAFAQTAVAHADAALAAGCDDGAVTYVAAMLHEFADGPIADRQQIASLYRKSVQRLTGTQYPPVRLLYATLRSARADSQNVPPDTTTAGVDRAIDLLPAVAADPVIPRRVLADVCNDLIVLRQQSAGDRLPGFQRIDAILSKADPNGYVLHYNRGRFYVAYAWDARGNGFANDVAPDAWPLFTKRLESAAAELTRAWELDPGDPSAPRLMLTVELGQGQGRDRMELWYKRTLAANPEDYDAAQVKLTYLEPKWYGSPEEMLEFARQTYKEAKPDSRMRTILFNAHQTIAYYAGRDATGQWQADPNYWARPGVWEDLHPLFQHILDGVPAGQQVGWRTLYALVAYHSKHYQEAHEQFELLDGHFDFNYIHDINEYDQLRASAERLAKDPDSAVDDTPKRSIPSGRL